MLLEEQQIETQNPAQERLDLLNKRLEDIGWALFFIMIGFLLLIPEKIPEGTWLIGTGVILIGINCIRYLKGIRLNLLSTVLGVLAVIGGLSLLLGLDLPFFAIFLILVGLTILWRSFAPRKITRHA